jgi:CheY-like chemotaxis protein
MTLIDDHERENARETRQSAPLIFYVEDDNDTRRVMLMMLKRYGYRVITDPDEESALGRIDNRALSFDLLLLDLGMPPADALAAAGRIREAATLDAQTPAVVIAYKYGAEMDGQDVEDCENCWVTYLEDGEQLERLLGRLLAPARQAA